MTQGDWGVSNIGLSLFLPSDLLQGLPLPELCWKPQRAGEPVTGPWRSVSQGTSRVVTEDTEDISVTRFEQCLLKYNRCPTVLTSLHGLFENLLAPPFQFHAH